MFNLILFTAWTTAIVLCDTGHLPFKLTQNWFVKAQQQTAPREMNHSTNEWGVCPKNMLHPRGTSILSIYTTMVYVELDILCAVVSLKF